MLKLRKKFAAYLNVGAREEKPSTFFQVCLGRKNLTRAEWGNVLKGRGSSPVEPKLSGNQFRTGLGTGVRSETFIRIVADASFATFGCGDLLLALDGQIEGERVVVS